MILGNAGRTARTGAGASIAALVIGALASLFYLSIYVHGGRSPGTPASCSDVPASAVLRHIRRRTAVTLPRIVAWVPSIGS